MFVCWLYFGAGKGAQPRTGAEFTWGRLKTYMGLEATDFFREELMTRDVISAIARNCDYHTGERRKQMRHFRKVWFLGGGQ